MRQLILIILLSHTAIGCTLLGGPGYDQQSSMALSQSAMQYLFPRTGDGQQTATLNRAAVDRIDLPLTVGLAFVPRAHQPSATPAGGQQVLRQLEAQLRAQPYVHRVVPLPDGSLNPSGGFAELDRVAFMHRLDAVLLVSFEQVAFTADLPASLLDLTIVGAYIIPGHNSEIHTRLTATAIHIPTRRYLLSADGTHQESAISTLVHSPAQIRTATRRGMPKAAEVLTANLQLALERFKAEAKQDPSLQIAGGAGSWGLLLTMALVGAASCVYLGRRSRQPGTRRMSSSAARQIRV